MEDKEVGELWQKYRPWSGLHGVELQAAKDNIALIRKLVEERNDFYATAEYPPPHRNITLAKALDDFGIPPETWSK